MCGWNFTQGLVSRQVNLALQVEKSENPQESAGLMQSVFDSLFRPRPQVGLKGYEAQRLVAQTRTYKKTQQNQVLGVCICSRGDGPSKLVRVDLTDHASHRLAASRDTAGLPILTFKTASQVERCGIAIDP